MSLSSDVTDVSPGNGTVVTNSSGNATFTLGFNGTEGAGVVEASHTRGGQHLQQQHQCDCQSGDALQLTYNKRPAPSRTRPGLQSRFD